MFSKQGKSKNRQMFVKINLLLFSTVLPSNSCPSQETEVTSTPTKPVDNVVITMKGLQDRNNNCLMEGWWKIKVN